jgi:alanyl-tRNA synthetase
MLRLTFHAGMRALFDARSKHEILAKIAAGLSCRIDDVPFLVRKAISEINATCRQLETVRAELVDLVAKTMLAKLPSPDAAPGPLVVHVLRENDDLGALRRLAGKLATDPRVVAIAAANDPASGELVLVVQRGSAAPFDCGAFIQAQAKARSGRGGGRPERAEGRFPRGTSLEVLAASAQSVMAS